MFKINEKLRQITAPRLRSFYLSNSRLEVEIDNEEPILNRFIREIYSRSTHFNIVTREEGYYIFTFRNLNFDRLFKCAKLAELDNEVFFLDDELDRIEVKNNAESCHFIEAIVLKNIERRRLGKTILSWPLTSNDICEFIEYGDFFYICPYSGFDFSNTNSDDFDRRIGEIFKNYEEYVGLVERLNRKTSNKEDVHFEQKFLQKFIEMNKRNLYQANSLMETAQTGKRLIQLATGE